MAAHWWWSWSIGLPSTAYNGAGFTVSSTANLSTNDVANLFSPTPGVAAPSEETHVRHAAGATMLCPPFPSPISAGWAVWRWRPNGNALTGGTARVLELMSGAATTRVDVRSRATGAPTLNNPLEVRVNGTLVGTSESLMYLASYYVIAVDFDLTTTPPQAGLVINGRREVARAGGSGVPTTIDRVRTGPGTTSGTTYLGDVCVFSALADLTDRRSQDVWVTFLDPSLATDAGAAWTPVGGSDLSAVADADTTSYTESSTSPSSILFGFEDTTTRTASWTPTLIYGLAVVGYGTASATQTNTTLDVRDALNVSAGTVNVTLTATAAFFGVWCPDDGAALAWSATTLNAATAIYSVA